MKTLSNIFRGPKTRMIILAFFMENPTSEFYELQVKNKTGISLGSANKHLKELASEGILIAKKKGNMNFYMLNKENITVKKLKIAYNLSLPLGQKIIEASKKLGCKTYLYGSVSRGEDKEDSDWDLLIISKERPQSIVGVFSMLGKEYNKKTRPFVFTQKEWLDMRKKDPAFYERVEKDKIELT